MTKILMVRRKLDNGGEQVLAAHGEGKAEGMILGSAVNGCVQWGEDNSKPEQRFFLDQEYAVAYLKMKCREFCGRDDVDFLVRDGDPIIVQPSPRQVNKIQRM